MERETVVRSTTELFTTRRRQINAEAQVKTGEVAWEIVENCLDTVLSETGVPNVNTFFPHLHNTRILPTAHGCGSNRCLF
jgi:hypothetical protein